ncbi:hypothetical protein RRG08_016355 [Elysia crispata]|uniref:Uncharacterized protein n=1 Tax=Elysia crispata TaxID=231223 RepID=A0AAE0Z580_9GAST|nr:hypothetical protein RRG08_016355 [Elysia crispata]
MDFKEGRNALLTESQRCKDAFFDFINYFLATLELYQHDVCENFYSETLLRISAMTSDFQLRSKGTAGLFRAYMGILSKLRNILIVKSFYRKKLSEKCA